MTGCCHDVVTNHPLIPDIDPTPGPGTFQLLRTSHFMTRSDRAMEKESFCLSGKPKPFSHKHQATNNEKKGRDLFSKFRSAPPIRQETAAGLKERPRTAVKKVSNKSGRGVPFLLYYFCKKSLHYPSSAWLCHSFKNRKERCFSGKVERPM